MVRYEATAENELTRGKFLGRERGVRRVSRRRENERAGTDAELLLGGREPPDEFDGVFFKDLIRLRAPA